MVDNGGEGGKEYGAGPFDEVTLSVTTVTLHNAMSEAAKRNSKRSKCSFVSQSFMLYFSGGSDATAAAGCGMVGGGAGCRRKELVAIASCVVCVRSVMDEGRRVV